MKRDERIYLKDEIARLNEFRKKTSGWMARTSGRAFGTKYLISFKTGKGTVPDVH